METLNGVVDEYEGHFQSDIEDLETKTIELIDQLEDKQSTIDNLRDENAVMQDIINSL